MAEKAFQDHYSDHWSHCFGCGRLNEHGYQIKSFWDGDETICHFLPKSHHIAIPGFVYGGLIASIIDCHGTGTASAALAKANDIDLKSNPAPRCVTASLQVDYLKPTPLGEILELRGKIKEIKGRKVIVDITVSVQGDITVQGQIVAVQVPEHLFPA